MGTTIKYCRWCGAETEHVEPPPIAFSWRWAVLWPLIRLIDRAVAAPVCLDCVPPSHMGDGQDVMRGL
jgi:hypothetical protein